MNLRSVVWLCSGIDVGVEDRAVARRSVDLRGNPAVTQQLVRRCRQAASVSQGWDCQCCQSLPWTQLSAAERKR